MRWLLMWREGGVVRSCWCDSPEVLATFRQLAARVGHVIATREEPVLWATK